MEKNKKIKKFINLFLIILIFTTAALLFSSCSLNKIIKESYESEEIPGLPEVDIDEKEISEIGKEEFNIEKSYDIEGEIGLVDDTSRDPFKPFYIEEEEEEDRNVFMLESIYVEDGVEYAEITLNDHLLKLKEGDIFAHNYSVQAINETSVVVLKGDEYLTIYIGVLKYD